MNERWNLEVSELWYHRSV